jgi:hypothetical protein
MKLENNSISAFEDLPTAEYKLIHDFDTGQPETITYTLSQNSDQLMGLHIVFAGIRIYNTQSTLDLGYDVQTAAGESVHTLNQPSGWGYNCTVLRSGGLSNTQGSGNLAQFNNDEFHMEPFPNVFRSRVTSDDDWQNVGTHEHYLFFYTNANGAKQIRMMGQSDITSSSTAQHNCYNRTTSGSDTYDTSGLAQASYWPSSPYTKIVFNTRASGGQYIPTGKIKIMELAL